MILVVEDDDNLRMVLKFYLERMGHEVRTYTKDEVLALVCPLSEAWTKVQMREKLPDPD